MVTLDRPLASSQSDETDDEARIEDLRAAVDKLVDKPQGRRARRQWELFTKKRGRLPAGNVQIAIVPKQSLIRFNALAWEAIGSPRRVYLYFDRANSEIGIKPIASDNTESLSSFAVYKQSSSSYHIKSLMFFEHYGLKEYETQEFDRWVKDGDLFVPARVEKS